MSHLTESVSNLRALHIRLCSENISDLGTTDLRQKVFPAHVPADLDRI